MKNNYFDNTIATKLRNREKVSAAWVQTGSNITAEIFGEAGFDMIVIDSEHSQTTLPGIVSMMQAIKGTGCVPIVRAPWNDMVAIKQILDCGAHAIHVPYISTKKEAEYAVQCCKYAPAGIRGIAGSQRAVTYGKNKADYYSRANQDIIVMIAIETYEGVKNIEEIVQVDGLDGIFIGPADLSTSMGFLGDSSAPEVQEAIKHIEKIVIPSNKFLGTVAPNMEKAIEMYDRGYTLLYTLSDTTGLMNLALNQVKVFKEHYGK